MIYRREVTYKNNWHDKANEIFDQDLEVTIYWFGIKLYSRTKSVTHEFSKDGKTVGFSK